MGRSGAGGQRSSRTGWLSPAVCASGPSGTPRCAGGLGSGGAGTGAGLGCAQRHGWRGWCQLWQGTARGAVTSVGVTGAQGVMEVAVRGAGLREVRGLLAAGWCWVQRAPGEEVLGARERRLEGYWGCGGTGGAASAGGTGGRVQEGFGCRLPGNWGYGCGGVQGSRGAGVRGCTPPPSGRTMI